MESLKEFVVLTCAGCGIVFKKDRVEYDKKKKYWYRPDNCFYHNLSCRYRYAQIKRMSTEFRIALKIQEIKDRDANN